MPENKFTKSLKVSLARIAKPQLSQIHKFKDIHKGEEGYFFGNGISIKWFDLKEFSEKISIGCNRIPFHKSFHDINLNYLMLNEPFWFYPGWWTKYITSGNSNPKQVKAYREIIRDNPDKQFFVSLSNLPVLKSNNVNYMFRDIVDPRLPNNFITNRIDTFEGSFRLGIMMAIYMGFEHVYLVGCDYTHLQSRTLHFFEKGKGWVDPVTSYEKDFLLIAKEFIDITTITLNGSSEFINSVTYKEHTGCEPIFQENDQLVDEKHLQAIDEWYDYDVFIARGR